MRRQDWQDLAFCMCLSGAIVTTFVIGVFLAVYLGMLFS